MPPAASFTSTFASGSSSRKRDGTVVVQAGEDWDALVARTVAEGLSGIECLSGIPGRVGATPIQNVGAYGQDVAETVAWVRVFDRETDAVRTMDAAECGFAYRRSVFKHRDRLSSLSESAQSERIVDRRGRIGRVGAVAFAPGI